MVPEEVEEESVWIMELEREIERLTVLRPRNRLLSSPLRVISIWSRKFTEGVAVEGEIVIEYTKLVIVNSMEFAEIILGDEATTVNVPLERILRPGNERSPLIVGNETAPEILPVGERARDIV